MIFSTAVVTLASIAAANAGVIRHRNFPVPSTYDQQWLEPYQDYHIRYLALNCQSQHNTSFFDQCCHPLLKTETLEKARPAQCIPSAPASSSASAALPTSTVIPDGDGNDDGEDCEDDDEPESSSAAPVIAQPSAPANAAPAPTPESSSAAAPAPTPESSSPAASPTKEKPSSTPAPAPAPAPTSTEEASSAKPAPTASSSSPFSQFFGGFSTIGDVVSGGIGTFFFQKGNPGNCGIVHQDSDFIVALPTNVYANGAHCGKKVAVANTKTGKVQVATVADSCPTCDNDQCIDLSSGLYDALGATRDQGVFPVVYTFLE